MSLRGLDDMAALGATEFVAEGRHPGKESNTNEIMENEVTAGKNEHKLERVHCRDVAASKRP